MPVLCKQLVEFRLDKQGLVRLRENGLGGEYIKIFEDLSVPLSGIKQGKHVLSTAGGIFGLCQQKNSTCFK